MTGKQYQAAQNILSQADGSTSGPTTTSGSYADLAEMSVTLVTGAGRIKADFDGTFFASTGGLTTTLAFAIDGGSEVHVRDYNLASGVVTGLTMTHTFTGLTPGSHTVKVRWKMTGAGTITAFGAQRSLIAEYKR